ncbi:MAG: adenine phosphoribosyltransferase [Planctomycetes bacterium]|nr:adenine phosphoribosyltransferase [Planctomycetota bacterium]
MANLDLIKKLIRDVPDFPKKGILFRDITPLLRDPRGFGAVIDALAEKAAGEKADAIVGIESRGFLFGAALSVKLGCGFVPIRKPKKLPWKTYSQSYALEYGTDTIEIHQDALEKGQRAIIVDDLLATGGTAEAAGKLVAMTGAQTASYLFVIELTALSGRTKLPAGKTHSILQY